MNQILKPELNILQNNIEELPCSQEKYSYRNHLYFMQFLLSTFIAIFFLIILFFKFISTYKKESISNQLIETYQLSTLYSNNMDYNTTKIVSSQNSPFVIGMIKIDKINLNYPIISHSNKELLNISLCRFAGPMPNEIGNLCIAGHNYVDYRFFSRLKELNKGDLIIIYDLYGKDVKYSVTKKYEVEADNLSCTNQNTQKNIITLLTCNNVSGKRLIIVAEPIY